MSIGIGWRSGPSTSMLRWPHEGGGSSSLILAKPPTIWGDTIEVLTSICARPDGRRGARNRAMRAVTAAKRDPGDAA